MPIDQSRNASTEAIEDQPEAEVGQTTIPSEIEAPIDVEQLLPEQANETMVASEQDLNTDTDPLALPDSGAERTTTVPLRDEDGPPVPPLDEKSVLGDRYRIDSLLGVLHGTNLYRVTDMQGYRVCWACGSSASMVGDTYCVECGAQLTGRFYRLQEFNMPPQEETKEGDVDEQQPVVPPLPHAILANTIESIAHVYDTLVDFNSSRYYVVWEEVYGRTLGSWVEGDMGMLSSPTSGHLMELDNPEEEQILGWMARTADILVELHAGGIVGCNITPNNLVVQPGDRLVLADPSACSSNIASSDAQQISDVRNLAMELERWYVTMREDVASDSEWQAADDELTEPGPQKMVAANEDLTGPLGIPTSPVAVLSKAREGMYPTAEEFADALYEVYEESKPIANMQLWTGRASDLGKVRQINEDSLLALETNILEHEGGLSTGLYVIADGMGGHQSGEVASSIAVRTIGSIVNQTLLGPLTGGDPVGTDLDTCTNALQQAVLEANRRISDLAKERHSDLGTTVTAALIIGNQLCVVNVGDSRTYLLREDQMAVITHDHSLVAQLVAAGQIAPEDIYTHPRRNEIYRALGDPRLTVDEVDTFTRRLQPGDSVLLCSDGLWDFVRDPDINSIIVKGQERDPQSVCQMLVDRANAAGGEDNISAILIRVLAPGE